MSMLTEPNQSLKREDLGDEFSIVDVKKCPLTTMLSKDGPPDNTIFHEPVDAYATPKITGRPDGKDVESAELEDPSSSRSKVGGRVQWFLRGLGVGKVAGTVPKVAGIGKGKEFAKGIVKKTEELKRDIESTFLSSRDSAEDNGADGSLTRGMGSYIQSGAHTDTDAEVPSAYRPGANQIISNAAVTDHTDEDVRGVLQEMWSITGSVDSIHAWCTGDFKKQVTSWTLDFTPAGTELPLRRFSQEAESHMITQRVDIFEGDFGKLILMPNTFINDTIANKQDAYLTHMDKWAVKTQQGPGFDPLANAGGGKKGAIDAILALVCKNPKAEAKFVRT